MTNLIIHEMEEKTASSSKKSDSEVSPDKATNSGVESKRKRTPNSFIYGKDFDCSSESQPRGAGENLSQSRPLWRQQLRRVPLPPPIPQNPIQPKATNSATKPVVPKINRGTTGQTATKVASKTASKTASNAASKAASKAATKTTAAVLKVTTTATTKRKTRPAKGGGAFSNKF